MAATIWQQHRGSCMAAPGSHCSSSAGWQGPRGQLKASSWDMPGCWQQAHSSSKRMPKQPCWFAAPPPSGRSSSRVTCSGHLSKQQPSCAKCFQVSPSAWRWNVQGLPSCRATPGLKMTAMRRVGPNTAVRFIMLSMVFPLRRMQEPSNTRIQGHNKADSVQLLTCQRAGPRPSAQGCQLRQERRC